jgi:hypothetical protein
MTSFSALLWVAAADHLASSLISLASQSLLAGQSVHSIHGKKKPKIKKSEMTSCLGTPIVLNENQRMILHTVLFFQTLRPCAGSLPFRKMLQRVPMLVLFTVTIFLVLVLYSSTLGQKETRCALLARCMKDSSSRNLFTVPGILMWLAPESFLFLP